MKQLPIKQRIIDAIKTNGGKIGYYDLAHVVFPAEQFPRAFWRPNRGGPPGCYMVLSRAIREHGFHMRFSDMKDAGVVHSTITIGRAATTPPTRAEG